VEKNTQKSVEDVLQGLYDSALERTYKKRIMEVRIESITEDLKMYKITGSLELSVSAELGDEENIQSRKFDVMTMENDPDLGVAQVFTYLNSIPMEYGDMIFEDGFEDIISGLLENVDDKAEITEAKAPVQ
jgi:hypothetical protein